MVPTFVISLKDETERRKAITPHLKKRGFDFKFVDATDGRPMNVLDHPDYNKKRRRTAHGRDLKPGEIGCLLSHRNIYQKIIDNNLDYAFIVEDDARLHEDTKPVLEALLKSNFDFDVIRLFGSPKVARGIHRKIINLYKDFWLVRLRTTPGGTQAQLISRKGAQKLLNALKEFTFPVDTVHGRCWETGIQSYSIQPGLAVQDESFESAIGDDRHNKTITLTGIEKTRYTLGRPLFKIGEALGKRWVYYANLPADLAARKKFG